MRAANLQVTYRHGLAIAAYYSLPVEHEGDVARSSPHAPGLVVDFAASGKPLGVEITAPGQVTIAAFNALLVELGLPAVDEAELAPLRAA